MDPKIAIFQITPVSAVMIPQNRVWFSVCFSKNLGNGTKY